MKYLQVQRERLGFNGVVMISKKDQVLYHVTEGMASQELAVPMKPETVFRIASISKQFTAMLVILAARDGKLHQHDSLGKFFPALTDPEWRKITLHQLLSHTSGIPHNEGIADYWTVKSLLPLTKSRALAEIFSMKLLFPPGSDMKYSSPGYFILSCILEDIYQCSYEDLLNQRILQPLRMRHTGVYTNGRLIAGLANGYHLLDDSLIKAPYRDVSLMKGAGDLYSNAEDLVKWNNSFSAPGTWSEDLRNQLFTAHTSKSPLYGYGWYIRPGKRLAYYHGGGSFGCSAISVWYPHEQMSIVILCNVSTLPVNELWSDIEKIVFGDPFTLPTTASTIQLSAAELQALAGIYRQGSHELKIVFSNNKLYAKLGTNPPFRIYAEDKLKFYGIKANVGFTFKQNKDGKLAGIEAYVNGQTHYFNKE